MKLVKFIKENKIIVLAFLIVLLTFGFLALPGQFAHYDLGPIDSHGRATFTYNLSGYEWIFATVRKVGSTSKKEYIGSVVPSGIAELALLALSIVGLCFSKKSSFVSLLVSLTLITIAILFFCTSAASSVSYHYYHAVAEKGDFSNIGWVPYVVASLNLIAGGLMMFRTILVLKEEAKHPVQQKGPSYSYLKK